MIEGGYKMKNKNKYVPDFEGPLKKAGIPVPSEGISNLRWIMRTGDYYALTPKGYWVWWDERSQTWKQTLYGPD